MKLFKSNPHLHLLDEANYIIRTVDMTLSWIEKVICLKSRNPVPKENPLLKKVII